MRIRRVIPAVLATGFMMSALAATPTFAAFPGANGRLVFGSESVAGNHTQVDLYTVNADGSHLQQLTNTPNRNEFDAAWNAHGNQLAFWRTPAPFGPGSIWVMDGSGQHQQQLTAGFDARDPAWSPSGTRIVFSKATGHSDLWTMRASDGSHLHRMTSGRAFDFEPAWSPDGTKIAFTRGHERGDVGDIYVKDLTSGVVSHITDSPAYDLQVAWAPTGDQLVFERDYDSASSVFVVNADGSQLHRLTSGQHFDLDPAFSPDGKFITFSSDRSDLLNDLWVMRSDGSHRHALLHMSGGEASPDWQPLTP